MLGFKRMITGLYMEKNRFVVLQAEGTEESWALRKYANTATIIDYSNADSFKDSLLPVIRSSGIKARKISLSIPDSLAKSIILDLEELPHKKEDAEKIIKWKSANRLGVNLRDSIFDYQVISKQGMVKVFVVFIRKDIITALESALFDLGFNVQRISMHSLNLFNLLALKESTDENFSVIVLIDNYFSIAIFKKGVLDYYRCKISVEHTDNFVKELKASFLSYRCVNQNITAQKIYLFDDCKGLEEIVKTKTEACVESVKLESLLSIKEPLQVDAEDKLRLLAALGAGAGI